MTIVTGEVTRILGGRDSPRAPKIAPSGLDICLANSSNSGQRGGLMATLEDYSRGDNVLARKSEAPREANAAEALFRYLQRIEQLGDKTIRYVSSKNLLIHEGGCPEGAAYKTLLEE